MAAQTNTIRIDSGELKIEVQMDDNDPHIITFNPNELEFAKNLHSLYFEAKKKLEALVLLQQVREKEKPEVDENGMPLDMSRMQKEYKEINEWFCDILDNLLGEGVSLNIFGGKIYTGEKVGVYLQLIEGIFKYTSDERNDKTAKYIKK